MEFSQKDLHFEDIRVRYWEGGAGEPLLLLHGTGPGAGSPGYWRKMLAPLAEEFHVIAYDLIGFGQSGRKAAAPFFDSALWQRQAGFMLDQFRQQPVNVMAHSLSGATALRLAASQPVSVKRLLTTGTLGAAGMAATSDTALGWTFPRNEQQLRDIALSLVYDGSLIDDQYIEARMKTLFSDDYADYFNAMFAGDKQRFLDEIALTPGELDAIECEILMVHGRNDRPSPYENSLRLAAQMDRADLVILNRCGHSIALEHPEKLLALSRGFFLP